MIITIELHSTVPLYLQLRRQIVEGIVRGELRPGDPLPSVRQMAVDLGINLHTVNKAYGVLQAEGFVEIFGRRGARIAPAAPRYDEAFLEELREQLRALYREARSRGVEGEYLTTLL
ncbi:MAG: GntR family transcriptional regulator, partial [Spirochaetales bacterium]|nr:GntR family transcriptional regulator [Spirochaetales bacterium]